MPLDRSVGAGSREVAAFGPSGGGGGACRRAMRTINKRNTWHFVGVMNGNGDETGGVWYDELEVPVMIV